MVRLGHIMAGTVNSPLPDFSVVLRQFRRRHRLTQSLAARWAGVGGSTWEKWERGQSQPWSLRMLWRLAQLRQDRELIEWIGERAPSAEWDMRAEDFERRLNRARLQAQRRQAR